MKNSKITQYAKPAVFTKTIQVLNGLLQTAVQQQSLLFDTVRRQKSEQAKEIVHRAWEQAVATAIASSPTFYQSKNLTQKHFVLDVLIRDILGITYVFEELKCGFESTITKVQNYFTTC
jgi:hypothetical protein